VADFGGIHTLDAVQVSAIWAVVVSGSSFDPINEDDHARIIHRMPPGTLGDDVTQLRHHHVGAVLLDQLGRVVLPRPAALVALHPDERQRPFA
jgi:hypothetical protein